MKLKLTLGVVFGWAMVISSMAGQIFRPREEFGVWLIPMVVGVVDLFCCVTVMVVVTDRRRVERAASALRLSILRAPGSAAAVRAVAGSVFDSDHVAVDTDEDGIVVVRVGVPLARRIWWRLWPLGARERWSLVRVRALPVGVQARLEVVPPRLARQEEPGGP